MFKGSTPPGGSFNIKGPLTPFLCQMVSHCIVLEHRFQELRGCLECFSIIRYESLRQSSPSGKSLQASKKGLRGHVENDVEMHSSCYKANKQTNPALPVQLGPSVQINNGPAKSTPVKLKAGSSFTLHTGKGGGGGVGNGFPSYQRQITHRCMIAQIILRLFTIQSLRRISVRVSRTPLCSTLL